jgi:hypothetical protein
MMRPASIVRDLSLGLVVLAAPRTLARLATLATLVVVGAGFAADARGEPSRAPQALRSPAPRDDASLAWIFGGRIWTDADGDGLSECGPASPLTLDVGDTVAVDVWIDTEAFEWSTFQVYVEWSADAFVFAGADYLISGGQNYSPDVWTYPEAVGLFGNGYARSGVSAIGRIYLRYESPVNGCVFPLLDDSYWAEIWSECWTGTGDRFFFSATASSCVDPSTPPAKQAPLTSR